MRKSSEQLRKSLQVMVGDAKLNMQDVHKQWETYCGRHKDGLRPESWQRQDFVPMNFIFSHTESLIPILLDASTVSGRSITRAASG